MKVIEHPKTPMLPTRITWLGSKSALPLLNEGPGPKFVGWEEWLSGGASGCGEGKDGVFYNIRSASGRMISYDVSHQFEEKVFITYEYQGRSNYAWYFKEQINLFKEFYKSLNV